MLGRLEACNVPLPEGWKDRFVQDPTAPSVGNWRGWAKIFLTRRKRRIGVDPSERLHESITGDVPDTSVLAPLHDQTSC
jgi:hypothetical protein